MLADALSNQVNNDLQHARRARFRCFPQSPSRSCNFGATRIFCAQMGAVTAHHSQLLLRTWFAEWGKLRGLPTCPWSPSPTSPERVLRISDRWVFAAHGPELSLLIFTLCAGTLCRNGFRLFRHYFLQRVGCSIGAPLSHSIVSYLLTLNDFDLLEHISLLRVC